MVQKQQKFCNNYAGLVEADNIACLLFASHSLENITFMPLSV